MQSKLNRKNFLTTSAGLAVAAKFSFADEVNEGIIDTHTHFYDSEREGGVPWPNKKDPLYRPILPKEFETLTRPYGVRGTVVVEASPLLEDNQFLLDLADREKSVLGVMGNVDPTIDGFKSHLKRFARHPRFCGVRLKRSLRETQNKDVMNKMKMFVDLGLSVDLNGGLRALRASVEISRQIPELVQVINHLPYSNLKPGEEKEYLELLQKAAENKNVYAKVSWMLKKDQDKTITDLEPYRESLDLQWSSWGYERVIFGSNWPVLDRVGHYRDLMKVMKGYTSRLGQDKAQAYFYKNAIKAYRLS